MMEVTPYKIGIKYYHNYIPATDKENKKRHKKDENFAQYLRLAQLTVVKEGDATHRAYELEQSPRSSKIMWQLNDSR